MKINVLMPCGIGPLTPSTFLALAGLDNLEISCASVSSSMTRLEAAPFMELASVWRSNFGGGTLKYLYTVTLFDGAPEWPHSLSPRPTACLSAATLNRGSMRCTPCSARVSNPW